MNRLLLTFGEIIEIIKDFFVTDYLGLAGWIWTVIALVALIAIIVIIVACVKHGKKKKATKLAAENSANQTAKPAETPVEEAEVKPVETPVAAEEKPVEEPVPEIEEEAPAEEPAPVVAEEVPEETAAAEDTAEEEPAKKAAESKVYHISKRKTDLKWQVKMSKGAKAIKLFNTQAEAIEFAKKLAINQDARIVIHKEDGSFRKITYKKNK